MKKMPLPTAELVRRMRDRQAQETAVKSVEEKFAYYRSKGQEAGRTTFGAGNVTVSLVG